MGTGTLPRDLLESDAYPQPRPETVELRETHASWVFLTTSDVYKVKKPVSLGFLDFSTLDARRRACEAEVRLNARLAAGVYLGLVPILRGHRHDAAAPGDLGLRIGGSEGDGELVDWAVHMLRLDDHFRGDVRLAQGRLRTEHVDRIAEHLAAFHARCEAGEELAAYASPAAIAANVRANVDAIHAELPDLLTMDEAAELEEAQLDFVEEREELLLARGKGGFVRDGHGDLRLEHFYLEDLPDRWKSGITVLDCVEFSTALRVGDVASDLAFLSMDLAARGRVDLAERLIARYASAANDFDLYALVDFYEGYRAYVRAKVARLVARTAGVSRAVAEQAEADARRYLLLALSATRRSLAPPSIVAVGGTLAAGKSTVAEAFAERLGAPLVSADRTRKAMLGVSPTTPMRTTAFVGPYDPRITNAVYDELVRRAALILASGRPVVIDASFRTKALRAKVRDLARMLGVPFVFAECRAPPSVCVARLDARERDDIGVSDGRRAIFDDFRRASEPFTEIGGGHHVVLDTTRPLDASLEDLARQVEPWPRGFLT